MKLQKRIANAVNGVIAVQKKFYKPPPREYINKTVKLLTKQHELKGTMLETYFKLFATSALLNQEPLYRYWKPRKKGAK